MEIVVKDLCKFFKKVPVIYNVNIKFCSGNIYGIIGRNGSGKSVFLKLLCSFYIPDSGIITQDGYNYIRDNSFPRDTRALIERPNFSSELSGYENLKMLAKIQNKIGEKEIIKALKDVNLYDDKDKKYSTYSLGMKQKLGIAQTIMENPKVIILDEPFNGIEEESVIKIKKILKKFKNEDAIIIITSHIKEDIYELADEIYRFDAGILSEYEK